MYNFNLMFFKSVFFISIAILLVSCTNPFIKKNEPNLIKENIDFTSVDAYPLLPECESITDRTAQKDCFYQKLASRIQNSLTKNSIELTTVIKDTVFVKIRVDLNGKASINTISLSNGMIENLPKLEEIIRNSITKLPILQPAIKSGIPVNSEFLLPILVNN